jgi:catechol 2,3-dioxygenase-like lactoylglutathione lyase family enzyme
MRSLQPTWLYTGLRVQNLARSIRFYQRMGFRQTKRGAMRHGGQFVDLAYPGSRHILELNFYPPANRFYEPFSTGTEFDHFGFEVEDIDRWARQLRRWRIPLVADFTEEPLRLIYARDPDGNWLEFCGRVAPPPPLRRRRG